MRAWQFSKPKGPGFGISRAYYLSVLSTRATMPNLLQIINPKGDGGALEGFGAPLMAGSTKDSLARPLERGAYALATKDRKTIVKMLVLSKEEAGFDPEALVRHDISKQLDPEIVVRIRATWTIAQMTFESHDPAVFPALSFHLGLAKRLATLTEGAVADPVSQRYLLPSEIDADQTPDAQVLLSVVFRNRPDGLHAFTLGMQKLSLPELEIVGLDPAVQRLATRFLLGVAQTVLEGKKLGSGAKIGPFEAREGGLDRGLWEGIEVTELLPPSHMTATDALESVQL